MTLKKGLVNPMIIIMVIVIVFLISSARSSYLLNLIEVWIRVNMISIEVSRLCLDNLIRRVSMDRSNRSSHMTVITVEHKINITTRSSKNKKVHSILITNR